jgi:acrylyl-CoA reductase (NADPH)
MSTFRAFVAETIDDGYQRGVREMTDDDLPDDGVTIDVAYSTINYKDSLATTADGRVARISPLIAGIDLAGVVAESDDETVPVGSEVIAHGYDLGVSRHGGLAERARVPVGWLVPLPDGLSLREAMAVGTAGYTAALSVLALLDHGLAVGDGPVVVTGATGGVGSTSVRMLSNLGHDVVAVTGKAAATDTLRSLGASSVVDRADFADAGKPLQAATWAGAVDCVGGHPLANVLAQLAPGAAAAASGNTAGMELPTTVLPFILRGVSLVGIDSVQTPIDRRREVWGRIATDLHPGSVGDDAHLIGLDGVEEALTRIGQGAVTGRYVVDVSRERRRTRAAEAPRKASIESSDSGSAPAASRALPTGRTG